MPYAPAGTVQPRPPLVPLIALFAGALAIAWAGIFVRLSETGPTASAFWRGALALPFLAAWALLEARSDARHGRMRRRGFDRTLFWCGLAFAADLYVWHLALLKTSVAAATLEGNLAPIVMLLLAWIVYRERPSRRMLAGVALAVLGVVLVILPKLGGTRASLVGDALGISTALFYGTYLLMVARLREGRGTGSLMFWTTLVFSLVLLPVALTEKFLPDTWQGVALLAGLALVAQSFGQGLIAYALAHLPAAFGAVGLYVQPVATAVYGWWLLGEALAPVQVVGGATVLVAIAVARSSLSRARGRQ
jgi:drug/metabolite transporter (DMT)-like permease